MITPINIQPRKKGGGLWGSLGSILGGVAGAIAAPFTGGASIPAGMALGGSIGSLAQGTPEVKGGKGPNPLETASRLDPEALLAGLSDANSALTQDMTIPSTQKQQIADTYFKPAMDQLNQTILKMRGR